MKDQEFYKHLSDVIEEQLQKWELPSVSLGVMQKGKVVFCDSFGYRDIEKKLKPDTDTLYQMGSSTKAFTAAACAILVDRGKLSWDKPLHKDFPWLKFYDEYTTMHVTLRDLLCHRTGLDRHDEHWLNSSYSRKELAQQLQYFAPSWPFRYKWGYQNVCYVAAGCLIEEASGMSWEDFIQKEILDPLHMDRTKYFTKDIDEDENHANPYGREDPLIHHGIVKEEYLHLEKEDRAKRVGSPIGPAGSLISNINDMMKWVDFQLHEGQVQGRQLISKENFSIMHKPQMLMGDPLFMPCEEMDFHSYGFGWMMETYRGVKMIDHGGNVPGYSTLVLLVPELELGITIFVNLMNTMFTNALAYTITDHYLGIYDGNWFARELAYMEEQSKKERENA